VTRDDVITEGAPGQGPWPLVPSGEGGGARGPAAAGRRRPLARAPPPPARAAPLPIQAPYAPLFGDAPHSTLAPFPPKKTSPRLILENLLKYGIRLNLVAYIANSLAHRADDGRARERLVVLACFPGLLLFAFAALGVERLGLALLRSEDKVGGRGARARACASVAV
jgi:hypothetical protein